MNVARRTLRRSRLVPVVVVWCAILLAVGVLHRWLNRGELEAATPMVLERPLSNLAMRIGSWEGMDVPIDQRVLEVAGNDDYVNRRYIDEEAGQFVDFHLAYTARPANMLGHRPSVCYPAQGWRHQEPHKVSVLLADGTAIDCLMHHFVREQPDYEGLVVLNYYVLQGRPTADWTDFWGPKWRRRNLTHDPNFYVAQVQIAVPVMVPALFERGENTVQRFAAIVAPLVRDLLPSGIDRPDEAHRTRSESAADASLVTTVQP